MQTTLVRPRAALRIALVVCGVGAGCSGTSATSTGADMATGLPTSMTFTLATGDGAANHWPGADGLVATMDDTMGSTVSPMHQSAANSMKSYSFEAFDFGGGATDTGLPTAMNAITFLQGTVTADSDVAKNGNGTLITGWTVSGTPPFVGHGAFSAQTTKITGSTYSSTTHALTLSVDFSATLMAGMTVGMGLSLTGQAYLVQAADYGTATGNAYVDGVVVPLAKAANAKAVFFAHATGTVPMSMGGTGGMFPSMPMNATLVGLAN